MRPLALCLLPALWLPAPLRADDGDARVAVDMPPAMQRHMLANMRDHLGAVAEIQAALAAGRFEAAATIAEQRLGLSSLAAHGAEHMAAHMPESMRAIGTAMHRAASRLAVTAQDASVHGDPAPVLGGLADVTRQCVACHAAYRLR